MILGDLLPTAGNTTILYNANVGLGAYGSLYVANQSNMTDFISIAITKNYLSSPSGNTYLMYNTPITGYHTLSVSEISLGLNQGLFVYSENGTTSFNFNGNTF